MNYQELSKLLRETANLLQADRIAEIDFAALVPSLFAAAESLLLAENDRGIAQKMLEQFREELRLRARATAQLVGGDSGLVEKLIDSAESTFEDLVKLSKQLALDFDKAFKPTLTEPLSMTRRDDKLSSYKS